MAASNPTQHPTCCPCRSSPSLPYSRFWFHYHAAAATVADAGVWSQPSPLNTDERSSVYRRSPFRTLHGWHSRARGTTSTATTRRSLIHLQSLHFQSNRFLSIQFRSDFCPTGCRWGWRRRSIEGSLVSLHASLSSYARCSKRLSNDTVRNNLRYTKWYRNIINISYDIVALLYKLLCW